MTVYTLPDLPYDYAALEPHISGKIMQLHHDKHHAAYVSGANAALDKLAEARDSENFSSVTMLEKDLAFHLGGHINHTVFWQNLSPEGGGDPDGDLAEAIKDQFGSLAAFRRHFAAVATSIQGSGWSVLAWDPLAQKLLVLQLHDQQANIPVGIVPLFMLDMWEHAFYLDYLNVKADYVKAVWNLVNWADVQQRLTRARANVI